MGNESPSFHHYLFFLHSGNLLILYAVTNLVSYPGYQSCLLSWIPILFLILDTYLVSLSRCRQPADSDEESPAHSALVHPPTPILLSLATCRQPVDSDEESPARCASKPVPQWAQPPQLAKTLQEQRHVNPGRIFGRQVRQFWGGTRWVACSAWDIRAHVMHVDPWQVFWETCGVHGAYGRMGI